MINKYMGRKEGLEISTVSPSDEPNSMYHHRKKSLSYDKGRNKSFHPDHDKKIILVNPEDKSVYHAQVITTSRYQGRKMGLGISRVSTDYDSEIIGLHRKSLLPDEGRNKSSKSDIDMASKPYLGITK